MAKERGVMTEARQRGQVLGEEEGEEVTEIGTRTRLNIKGWRMRWR
jgi:hypothetical protein